MTAALYTSIWSALALLAGGEIAIAHGREARHAGRLHLAGAALALVHVLVAFAAVHGWSHPAAVRATADRTAAVFGIDSGAGVWINYGFVLSWFVYGWSLIASSGTVVKSGLWQWLFRAFAVLMVASGAIVFAGASRRIAGLALTAVLLWSWWRHARRSRSAWKKALV